LSATSLRKTPCVSGRCPVRNDARMGEQTGMPETALTKQIPSRCSRSNRRSQIAIGRRGQGGCSVVARRSDGQCAQAGPLWLPAPAPWFPLPICTA
jgi:hypothetical protein